MNREGDSLEVLKAVREWNEKASCVFYTQEAIRNKDIPGDKRVSELTPCIIYKKDTYKDFPKILEALKCPAES